MRCICKFATGIMLAFMASQAVFAQFAPNETLVSPKTTLIDFEFSQSRAQFAWVDEAGSLWLGNVDRDTGAFQPVDGMGILIDSDAMTTKDVWITFNGPEWVLSADGDKIAYTKFLKGRPHIPSNARVAIASEGVRSRWSTRMLSRDLPRNAPYGSETEGDRDPRLTYVDNEGRHFWRSLGDASTESIIPGVEASPKPVRQVRGARALIYTITVDGVRQIVRYDLDSSTLEQLTFDAGDKGAPWMWRAPEYGGEFVFMALVNNTELRIYRQQSTGFDRANPWAPVYAIAAPAGSKISSPEPFVYQQKSYIFMAMVNEPNSYPSDIWISNIETSAPLFRRVSDNSNLRLRSDPEVFITSRGPLIYYNRFDPSVNPDNPYCLPCSEGVYMADPGLGL